jgi:DNA helicase-2/ATP-dependent DNA helicase PcrA
MDEAANIVGLIKKMKEDKMKSRSEVAILYRTNAQSSPFEQVLVQEGIPYKIRGAYKFFERKEIKDVLSYITYILNPESSVSLKRIINIPARKIGKTTISSLEEYAILNNLSLNDVIEKHATFGIRVPPQGQKGIADFYAVIHPVTDIMESISPSEVIDKLVKNMKYKDYLIKEEGSEAKAEERYENI